jgi:tetratricopeptide (TPR) repeat protein
MNPFDLSSTELNEIQNHDDFIVIWISSDDVPNELKIFVDYLKKFDSNETCINYINQFKTERKILLVLTDLESLSNFEDFVQIHSIYIFKKELQNNQFDKKNHSKLVDIFENIDKLIDRLRKDILLTYRNDLPISISSLKEITTEQSLMNLLGNTLMFMWNQLFIYYLIKSPNIDMNKLKKDMLEQCRFEYTNNESELKKIDDFDKNCSDDNILKWYTKDSFLYRLLNKAFRTQNIELICKFQYFIILLYRKFEDDLSKEQHDNPTIVYRGQILNENTLKKLKSNVKSLISINTILSTSRDETIARSFIHGAPTDAAIFRINLPDQIYNSFRPFVDISKFSSIPEEKEIIFFVETVFSIDSVEQDNDSIWIINLTLNNEISKHIEKLISDFHQHLNDCQYMHHLFMKTDDFNMIDRYYNILTKKILALNTNPTLMMYIHLAFFFSNFGFYEKAIELYKEAMSVNKISIDSPESIVLHIILGYLYYHSSKYEDAFTPYGIALSLLDETNLLTSELYSHIGDSWNKMKNEDIALSYYKEALKIANHQDFPSLPNVYQNIIGILKKQGKSDEASIYEKQAEEIDESQYHLLESTYHDQRLLKKFKDQLDNTSNLTSIERGDLLYKIGLRLMVKGDFDQALVNLLEAKELVMKEPPSWDRFPRHLSTLFDNIAWLYLFCEDYLTGLKMLKKGINLRSNFHFY